MELNPDHVRNALLWRFIVPVGALLSVAIAILALTVRFQSALPVPRCAGAITWTDPNEPVSPIPVCHR